jgi:hypothetical protein
MFPTKSIYLVDVALLKRLNGLNYPTWKFTMESVLIGRGLLNIIKGTKPPLASTHIAVQPAPTTPAQALAATPTPPAPPVQLGVTALVLLQYHYPPTPSCSTTTARSAPTHYSPPPLTSPSMILFVVSMTRPSFGSIYVNAMSRMTLPAPRTTSMPTSLPSS